MWQAFVTGAPQRWAESSTARCRAKRLLLLPRDSAARAELWSRPGVIWHSKPKMKKTLCHSSWERGESNGEKQPWRHASTAGGAPEAAVPADKRGAGRAPAATGHGAEHVATCGRGGARSAAADGARRECSLQPTESPTGLAPRGGGPWWGGRVVLEQCAPGGWAPVIGIRVGAPSSKSQLAAAHAAPVPEGLRPVGGTPRRAWAETDRGGDRGRALWAYSSTRAAFGVVEGSEWGKVFLACFYVSPL